MVIAAPQMPRKDPKGTQRSKEAGKSQNACKGLVGALKRICTKTTGRGTLCQQTFPITKGTFVFFFHNQTGSLEKEESVFSYRERSGVERTTVSCREDTYYAPGRPGQSPPERFA